MRNQNGVAECPVVMVHEQAQRETKVVDLGALRAELVNDDATLPARACCGGSRCCLSLPDRIQSQRRRLVPQKSSTCVGPGHGRGRGRVGRGQGKGRWRRDWRIGVWSRRRRGRRCTCPRCIYSWVDELRVRPTSSTRPWRFRSFVSSHRERDWSPMQWTERRERCICPARCQLASSWRSLHVCKLECNVRARVVVLPICGIELGGVPIRKKCVIKPTEARQRTRRRPVARGIVGRERKSPFPCRSCSLTWAWGG